MSHDIHSADEVGTFNIDCPDCNTPWFQSLVAVAKLHRPDEAGECRECTVPSPYPDRGPRNANWPCPTIQIMGLSIFERIANMVDLDIIRKGDLIGYTKGAGSGRRARRGEEAGGGYNPPQTDRDVPDGSVPLRTVPGSSPGNLLGLMSGGLQPLFVQQPSSGSGGSGPETEVLRLPPQLKSCNRRKLPSSVEKCGKFLVAADNFLYCVEHGYQI